MITAEQARQLSAPCALDSLLTALKIIKEQAIKGERSVTVNFGVFGQVDNKKERDKAIDMLADLGYKVESTLRLEPYSFVSPSVSTNCKISW